MSERPVILKFSFWKDWPVLTEALDGEEPEDSFEVNELITMIALEKSCILLIAINEKDDLVKAASILKGCKTTAKQTLLKPVAVNFSGKKNFDALITKIGIQEIIEPTINQKVLKLKLDLWTKSLNIKHKQAPVKEKIHWQSPLQCQDDIWLIKDEDFCKKVLTKWLIKFIGPGPFIGQWVETDKTNKWNFVVNEEEKDLLLPDNGKWIYEGENKPEFVWAENRWQIGGSQFKLYYQSADPITKFEFNGEALSIAKDSPYAKEKESIYVSTFDKEMVIKKEAINFSNDSIEDEVDHLSDLSGEGKTDHIKQSNLEGKYSTDELTYNNLELHTRNHSSTSDLILNDVKIPCVLDDFYDGKIFINSVSDDFIQDTHVQLTLNFDYFKKKSQITVSGRIVEITPLSDKKKYLSIEVDPEYLFELSEFIKLYECLQREITVWLQETRGY